MKTRTHLAAITALAVSTLPSLAHAHIKMLLPAPWIVEDDGVGGFGGGNPQKTGPCGTDPAGATLTNTITEFRAGETIEVKWRETIDHPGYFRIALAADRAQLKDPTLTFDANCNVDNSKVPTGPHDNVLADGILLQNNGGAARPGHPNYTYEVTLPNEPCEKCTLQLIQFMENHPPSCIYYHCADIRIVAGGPVPAEGDAGTGTPGTGTLVDASVAFPDASVTRPPTGTQSDASVLTPGASGSDAGSAVPSVGADAGASSPKDDGGCSVGAGGQGSLGTLAGLGIALAALVARRRPRKG